MPVPFGNFRDLVEILQPVLRADSAGGERTTYQVTGTAVVWLKALRGREFIQARQVVSEVTHKVIGHFHELEGLTAESRVRAEDGREFDITAPIPADDGLTIDAFATQRRGS